MIELRELQLCQLDIALDIKKICEENDIKYFLIAGTLLGAVRHKGFIPWDDDLDIGMLREDYNKFIEVCQTKLPDHLFLQTWDTDKGFAFPFCKIMLKGTVFREEANGDADTESMIFVDIFPFDNRVDNKLKRKYYWYSGEIAKKLLQYKLGYNMAVRSKHKILHKILKILSFFVSKCRLKETIIRAQENSNKKETRYVLNSCSAYGDKEMMEKSGAVVEMLSFEGYDFAVPIGRDQLLKNTYGDYMKLPPVEKRGNRHKAVNATLGAYVIRNHASREENCL